MAGGRRRRAASSQARFLQGRDDVVQLANQNQRVVRERNEIVPHPESRCVPIDGVHRYRPAGNQVVGVGATLERVDEERRSQSLSGPGPVDRELAKEKARHGIGRLTGPYRSGEDCRSEGGRRKPVVTDYTAGVVHDSYGRKPLFLV
jgi:hypothetical protein